MVTDLASWLLAQIADDEAAARAAYDEASDYRVVGSELAELHFVNWKPDRVLVESAAKRAIVELHKSWPVLVETPPEFTSDTSDLNAVSFSMSQRIMWMTNQEYRERFGDEPPTAPIIRLLAQPYADRPGWDPAWKVET